MAVVVLSFIRVLGALAIAFAPLTGFALSIFLDGADWYFVVPDSLSFYQAWDKLLDLFYLSVAFAVSRRWANKLARRGSRDLFFLRAFGVLLFLASQQRSVLFFFPNLFEFYFLFYLITLKLLKKDPLTTRPRLIAFIALISIPKLIQEYIIHFAQLPFWEWIK